MGLGLVADQLADLKLGELLNTPPPGLDEGVAIAKVVQFVNSQVSSTLCLAFGMQDCPPLQRIATHQTMWHSLLSQRVLYRVVQSGLLVSQSCPCTHAAHAGADVAADAAVCVGGCT